MLVNTCWGPPCAIANKGTTLCYLPIRWAQSIPRLSIFPAPSRRTTSPSISPSPSSPPLFHMFLSLLIIAFTIRPFYESYPYEFLVPGACFSVTVPFLVRSRSIILSFPFRSRFVPVSPPPFRSCFVSVSLPFPYLFRFRFCFVSFRFRIRLSSKWSWQCIRLTNGKSIDRSTCR